MIDQLIKSIIFMKRKGIEIRSDLYKIYKNTRICKKIFLYKIYKNKIKFKKSYSFQDEFVIINLVNSSCLD